MADHSPSPAAQKLALDFKSANLYALRIVLQSAETEALQAALAKRMQDAGSFFQNEPVVIDASRIEAPIDWPALLAALREHELPPIGVVAEGANLQAAREAGLIAVELASAPVRPQAPAIDAAAVPPALDVEAAEVATVAAGASNEAEPAESERAESERPDAGAAGLEAAGAAEAAGRHTPAPAAMVVTRPLRSGQRVYARGTDLVVVGMVSQGAEVIADGNIHVYGPLRGKAMAGARGDTAARIFTTQLDPELLAIAGVYRVVEDRLPTPLHNRAAVVSLAGETLNVTPLSS